MGIESKNVKVFRAFNSVFLILVASTCLIPFIHIIAVSFSSDAMVSAGLVTLYPKNFTASSYVYLLNKADFWTAFGVSVQRTILGPVINMLLVIVIAYPLSKDVRRFKYRTAYVWYFFFTAIFSGGLIPQYVLVYQLKLIGTIWALILPTGVNVFNVVMMLNFFRQIPRELEEASFMDGAGHFRTLWQIYVPCSLPSIATLTLFAVVFHWNSWFDGMIYSSRTNTYPLQSYLQMVISGIAASKNSTSSGMDYELIKNLSSRTLISAQIIIATIPILAVYPFLQKYFVAGIVVGGVKG